MRRSECLVLLGTSQTADQNHCGWSPLAAWVVHKVTVVLGGGEVNRTALGVQSEDNACLPGLSLSGR
jgi:hypothetical protein